MKNLIKNGAYSLMLGNKYRIKEIIEHDEMIFAPQNEMEFQEEYGTIADEIHTMREDFD